MRQREPMSIEVYPQLSRLLAERGLTEEDLSQQIREQFGLNASVMMVTQLTQQGSLHAANIEVAVAIVQVLGIGLDDLFFSVAIAWQRTKSELRSIQQL